MAFKSIYTKKLGKIVAQQTGPGMQSGNYHIIPHESGKWMVVPEGSTRALRVLPSLVDAEHYIQHISINSKKGFVVFVHDKTGTKSVQLRSRKRKLNTV